MLTFLTEVEDRSTDCSGVPSPCRPVVTAGTPGTRQEIHNWDPRLSLHRSAVLNSSLASSVLMHPKEKGLACTSRALKTI